MPVAEFCWFRTPNYSFITENKKECKKVKWINKNLVKWRIWKYAFANEIRHRKKRIQSKSNQIETLEVSLSRSDDKIYIGDDGFGGIMLT